jgi:hypothetical protein
MEHCRYDDDGQMLTGSFMDYVMPRAHDLPSICTAFHPVPSPRHDVARVLRLADKAITGILWIIWFKLRLLNADSWNERL